MNVKTLINILKTLKQNVDVYVEGYEGGVKDVTEIIMMDIERDVNKDIPRHGDHEHLIEEDEKENKTLTNGYVIS